MDKMFFAILIGSLALLGYIKEENIRDKCAEDHAVLKSANVFSQNTIGFLDSENNNVFVEISLRNYHDFIRHELGLDPEENLAFDETTFQSDSNDVYWLVTTLEYGESKVSFKNILTENGSRQFRFNGETCICEFTGSDFRSCEVTGSHGCNCSTSTGGTCTKTHTRKSSYTSAMFGL